MSKRNQEQSHNTEKKRPGRPKKPSNLNNLLTNKHEVESIPEHIPENQDNMLTILKQINENEMRMAIDESLAHAVANSNVGSGNTFVEDKELSEILENIRIMEEIEKNGSQISNTTQNIIFEQDRQYEESLRQDIEKERQAKIDERNRLEQEEMEKAIKESMETMKLLKTTKPIPEDKREVVEEVVEEVPLTKEQIRQARLAFFTKKN